jgi:O-antigen ligase
LELRKSAVRVEPSSQTGSVALHDRIEDLAGLFKTFERYTTARLARPDRSSFARPADWSAVAVAVALPWSTTAVSITIAVWLVFLLPSLDAESLKRTLATPAAGFAVLLWCLGAIGMLWADVNWHDRFAGLDSFHRLLAIPLLLAQFRRSSNGIWVACGFLISSTTVLIASYAIVLALGHRWHGVYGVPVHDTIFQGTEFLICGFGALGYAALAARQKEVGYWCILIFATGALFLINFAFATASRSALAIASLMLLLLGARLYRWKGIWASLLLAIMAGSVMWFASPVLRDRVARTVLEMQEYRASGKATSVGEHISFLRESLTIVGSAPIIGHGTGSIAEQFERITAGKTGVSAVSTVNPHNQTLAVAIQVGAIGAFVLWAMWIAHLLLFAGQNRVAWLGLVVVTENILSSTVHSHLFDFNSGWLYVFGVGVLGGAILSERDKVSKKIEIGG